MRILLLAHAFNSLTQRLFAELREDGHEVSVELDVNDAVTSEAVAMWRPNVVLAPYLRRAISHSVWQSLPCLIVHPGPPGDRGPSALDRAILEGRSEWGVTVLKAEAGLDAGPVWATERFPMRDASKSSLYRNEVTEAAVRVARRALAGLPDGGGERVPGPLRPAVRQVEREIDWQRDGSAEVLRKIRSGDGSPGIRDEIEGRVVYLYDARPADGLGGQPGALIARCKSAVARATVDGAVWIGHLREPAGGNPFKLPAAAALGDETVTRLPDTDGFDEIAHEEVDGVGYLSFPFYNGAMSVDHCQRLRDAYLQAVGRNTRVLVLMGGPEFFSNGLHLNVIEAAASPADESWRNIEAMDDLVREIITTTSHITVAALQGNAGAGGCFLALAADQVWARTGVVLNPHYKAMGNLYGSEYWTYLLPRRLGEAAAHEIVETRLPIGAAEARRLGLVDRVFGDDPPSFAQEVRRRAADLAIAPGLHQRLSEKQEQRRADEAAKPLGAYRAEELERLKLNFYGFDTSYHVARSDFVRKVPKSRTPTAIAFHRRKRQ